MALMLELVNVVPGPSKERKEDVRSRPHFSLSATFPIIIRWLLIQIASNIGNVVKTDTVVRTNGDVHGHTSPYQGSGQGCPAVGAGLRPGMPRGGGKAQTRDAPQGPQDCKPSTLNFHILPPRMTISSNK